MMCAGCWPAVFGEESDMTQASAAMTRPALLRRWAVGVFALVLAGLPTAWLAAPAVSRADPECAPGWAWSVELNV